MAARDQRLVVRSELPVARSQAFAWHDRPGALPRLTPPFMPAEVADPGRGLAEGSRVVLRLPVGPLRGPLAGLAPRWVAEHTRYDPPREFVDVQRSGPFARFAHRHRFEDLGAGRSALVDDIAYRLPLGRLGQAVAGRVVSGKLEAMFAYRHRVTREDLAAHAAKEVEPMHVLITGASGLVGSALTAFLTTGGHTVTRLVRRAPASDDEARWDPATGEVDRAALAGADAVIHLAGEGIAERRWSAEQKQRIRDSRVDGTRTIAQAMADLGDDAPRTLVCASGAHAYGDRGDAELDESSEPGEGFLADVVRDWEAAADPAREAGIRTVHVRTGIVQDPAGGALGKVLPLFKLGLGGRLGSGRQWWSWVSRDDVVGILHHALTNPEVSGPINATAPNPVTNAEWTRVLGRVLGRPTALPVPALAPKVLLGTELAEELLFFSIKVHPAKALATGYTFRHPDLEDALRFLLGREQASS